VKAGLHRPRRHRGGVTRWPALISALALVTVGSAAGVLFGPAPAAVAYPTSTVMFDGHGYGHGIGMGQWGSLGYALGQDGGAGNFTYQQILAHYYGAPGAGSSSLATLGTAPAPPSLHNGNVIVAMTEVDNDDMIATAESGAIDYPGGSATAVLFRLVSPGDYTIFTSGGCAGQGGWTQVATGVDNPTASAANGGPVFLCGPNLELHGTLTALANSDGDARTVNTLPLEQYVADVAPAESPSTWGDLGGAGPQGQDWGFQQSEAQTVAARSYVEASPLGYGGYADTCDQTCQSYPGMRYENPLSTLAAQQTAGQVMVIDGTSAVADTEYSASSGGYSTGDQFPAVIDAGDAICIPQACNPNHDWTQSVPVSSIEAAFPTIGTLDAITVTSRNGLGDYGGRVENMTLEGSSGSVQTTGDEFAADLNLPSDWFIVSGQPSGGVGGYWIDADDGGVFSFGNAAFHGSTGNIKLNQPMVGMAATPDAGGYWEVASDGGIFSFGDAKFHGSTGGIVLNKPIVGMVPTHDGGGYWLVASDGGVFAFGDAKFYGSLGGDPPSSPVVGVAPTSNGAGYWMLEGDGTVVAFGDAPGSLPQSDESPPISLADSPMAAMIPDLTSQGFIVVDQSGQAFSFGDAPYFGDVASTVPGYSGRVVGIAVTPESPG
jgi:SpoIID/LytB domain protein